MTLFECLIYLALFSFVATSSMLIVTRLWQSFITRASIERSHLSLYSAFDALSKEIRSASPLRKNWKQISPTALIWPLKGKEKKDRGWALKNNKLMRIEGVYQQSTDQWTKKQSSSVAHITELRFLTIGDESISHIEASLSDGITTIREVIALHNRDIHE